MNVIPGHVEGDHIDIQEGFFMKKQSIKAWAVILWLLIWQLASMAVGRDILLVSPLKVLARLMELMITAPFWASIGFSLLRIGAGFLLATLLGAALAVLAQRFNPLRDFLSPAMRCIKAVPVASFIILALVWFASENLSLLIAFLMVLPIIYTNVLEGLGACDPRMEEMARVFAIPPTRYLRYVILPQLYPYFRSGCSIALGLCWKAGIAAEVIGMPDGSIGEQLQQAKVYLDTPDLFAWTVVIVLLSAAFERIALKAADHLALRLERM